MGAWPGSSEEQTWASFWLGALLCGVACFLIRPWLAIVGILPWVAVAFWQTTLVPYLFPPEATEEEKFHREGAKMFQRVEREVRWWRTWKKDKDTRDDTVRGLQLEVARLRERKARDDRVDLLKKEVDALKADAVKRREPATLGNALLEPAPDKLPFRAQQAKPQEVVEPVSSDPLEGGD